MILLNSGKPEFRGSIVGMTAVEFALKRRAPE
jgi:hypothetical protein